MKIWIDDVRVAPNGYHWFRSVNEVKNFLKAITRLNWNKIELIDIDHDAGDYVNDGGDYIKILDWFEEMKCNFPIRIHSMNPVGVENMRRIIRKNGWTEVN